VGNGEEGTSVNPWWYVAIGVTGLAFVFGMACWLRSRVRYVIGRSSLRVMCLGVTLRRIPFTDIERASTPKREAGWTTTESWRNTWSPDHRELVVHRRTGWRRRVLITPKHRYAFRAELRTALEKAGQSMGAEEDEVAGVNQDSGKALESDGVCD